MNNPKPARLIENLLAQTKQDARTIADFEAKLRASEVDKNKAVDATAMYWKKRLDEKAAAHQAELAQQAQLAEDDRQRVVHEVQALTGRVITAKESHADMTKALTEARDEIAELREQRNEAIAARDAANARMADIEPRIALMEQQRLDLEKICDKVRDRMKRKEQEDERAILNRKALVGLVPGLRRS